jgi:hypothetical protein
MAREKCGFLAGPHTLYLSADKSYQCLSSSVVWCGVRYSTQVTIHVRKKMSIFKTAPKSGLFTVDNLYDQIGAFLCRHVATELSGPSCMFLSQV